MGTEAAPQQLVHALPRQQHEPATGPGPPCPSWLQPSAPSPFGPHSPHAARPGPAGYLEPGPFNEAHWILVPVPKPALEEQLSCDCAKPPGRPGVPADKEARKGV